MSLDKAIEHGKEKRKQYYGAKSVSLSCRNHGGRSRRQGGYECPHCLENRTHKFHKEEDRTDVEVKEMTDDCE